MLPFLGQSEGLDSSVVMGMLWRDSRQEIQVPDGQTMMFMLLLLSHS